MLPEKVGMEIGRATGLRDPVHDSGCVLSSCMDNDVIAADAGLMARYDSLAEKSSLCAPGLLGRDRGSLRISPRIWPKV